MYYCSDILLKKDICLHTICKRVLAQAACSLHKDLAKYRMGLCHLDVCGFRNGMSDNLANGIAEHRAQLVRLVSNSKHLPHSRAVIGCLQEFLANRQNPGIWIVIVLPLLTSCGSLYHCALILIRISQL